MLKYICGLLKGSPGGKYQVQERPQTRREGHGQGVRRACEEGGREGEGGGEEEGRGQKGPEEEDLGGQPRHASRLRTAQNAAPSLDQPSPEYRAARSLKTYQAVERQEAKPAPIIAAAGTFGVSS